MSEKLKWKNTGGPFSMADGRKIKRNEVFEATEAEIPKGFRDTIKPLDSLPKVAPRKWKHKRYADGKNLDYDNYFAEQVTRSPILRDSKNRDVMDPTGWQLVSSKRSLEGLLAEWADKEARTADLLGKIDAEFVNLKVQARRHGKLEPETLPPALLEQKFLAEARADVTAEEIDFIREILAKREAKEQAEKDARLLLTHGPIGSGHGDPLREIDGQAVVVNPKGDLVICEPKSAFHGMLVRDYRQHIIGPFQKWLREPPTKAELELGPNRPVKDASDPKNWPGRPEGV